MAALGQRYDVLSDAGQGSMGNVFKARDRETGEVVALKLLKPEIANDQAMMERFKNELLFARKITHKNVCRVHDFNRIGGVAYTSMEFVEGESLRSVLNRFGGLPLRKGIDLAQQICSGLKEAHAQGIVHRDLKPENIMVDDRGKVKIMDFGIARSMDVLTRMTGAMVGTPAYMAPEQVGGKAVDYRTDIYSLGLILYEIFTGTQAFRADNAVAVAMKQLNEQPVAPCEVEPGVPAPIERAILKCLEKDPAKRFQSVEELDKALLPPGAQAAAAVASSTTAGRSTQEVWAQYATPPPAARVAAVALAPRRPSKTKWPVVLCALLLVVVVAGALGKWAKRSKFAKQLPPPAQLTAPAPPYFALTPTAPESSTGAPAAMAGADIAQPVSAEDATSTDAPDSSIAPALAAPAAPAQLPLSPTPTVAAVASPAATSSKTPPTASVNAPPADVQQRADAAFKEQPPAATNTSDPRDPPRGSVLRGRGPSYIWVGRFEREDRAQDASRKLQGLGLPAIEEPRRGPAGAFYVVLTGPVAPAKLPSEIDWLKTQGFANVREVKGLGNRQGYGGDASAGQGGTTP